MNYITEPSFLRLVAVNIVTIIFAVWQSWGIIPLMYIFWGQSVIIGFFNAYDIFTLKDFRTDNFTINGQKVEATPKTRRSVGLFFLLHYGFFHLMYFIFIPVIAAIMPRDWGESFDAGEFRYTFYMVILNILLFFISYLMDFRYKRKHLHIQQNIGTLMFFPYMRTVPLHAVIVSAFFLGSKNSLLLFLGLKLLTDAGMHIMDRVRYKNAVYVE